MFIVEFASLCHLSITTATEATFDLSSINDMHAGEWFLTGQCKSELITVQNIKEFILSHNTENDGLIFLITHAWYKI